MRASWMIPSDWVSSVLVCIFVQWEKGQLKYIRGTHSGRMAGSLTRALASAIRSLPNGLQYAEGMGGTNGRDNIFSEGSPWGNSFSSIPIKVEKIYKTQGEAFEWLALRAHWMNLATDCRTKVLVRGMQGKIVEITKRKTEFKQSEKGNARQWDEDKRTYHWNLIKEFHEWRKGT